MSFNIDENIAKNIDMITTIILEYSNSENPPHTGEEFSFKDIDEGTVPYIIIGYIEKEMEMESKKGKITIHLPSDDEYLNIIELKNYLLMENSKTEQKILLNTYLINIYNYLHKLDSGGIVNMFKPKNGRINDDLNNLFDNTLSTKRPPNRGGRSQKRRRKRPSKRRKQTRKLRCYK